MALIRRALGRALASSTWRRKRLLILCYHGFSTRDEHLWNPSLYLSADVFRARLAALKAARAEVLPLAEALERLDAGTLPPCSVTITVDDGGADFHAVALPILKEFGYPATVYLTTYFAIHPRPVFPLVCSYLVWQSGRDSIDLSEATGGAIGAVFPRAEDSRLDMLRALARLSRERNLSSDAEEELARSVAEAAGVAYDAVLSGRLLRIMNAEEVLSCDRAGIAIELHTHRHRTPLDEGLFRREIEDNRTEILRITGRSPTHFCYPLGDYRLEFLPWLQRLGVASAVTCTPGLASSSSPRLLLPRLVDTSSVSGKKFTDWVWGGGAVVRAVGDATGLRTLLRKPTIKVSAR